MPNEQKEAIKSVNIFIVFIVYIFAKIRNCFWIFYIVKNLN